MIRIASQPKPAAPEWHEVFLRLLPSIRQHARIAFATLAPRPAKKLFKVSSATLRRHGPTRGAGQTRLAYATPLAQFGIRQVRDGRMTGGHLNCRDVLSPYCRKLKGITVERLDKYDETEECWQEIPIPDQTCTPADLAASRIDVPAWFQKLKPRDRRIARFLGIGNRTSDAAEKFGMSEGRVSQLRR